ncbi:MAG: hypothetical protein ABIR72_18805 [Mucilaginibacter sp.]
MQFALHYMSLSENRHISFYKGGETFLVPAQSEVERKQDKIKVRFRFQQDKLPAEIDEVIADNEQGFVRMVTSKGKEFTAGPLFDQLYVWYDYIVKR